MSGFKTLNLAAQAMGLGDAEAELFGANERQLSALRAAEASVQRVLEAMAEQAPMDCWTVDLRDAILALGQARRVWGRVVGGCL